MLIPQPCADAQHRSLRRQKQLWHDGEKHTPSMGCLTCPERAVCGGLQLERPLYSCLDFCCGSPEACDKVCLTRPKAFANSVREVGGFDLQSVPRTPVLPKPALPPIVAVLYNRCKRNIPFDAPAVSLPLYGVIARHNGKKRYTSPEKLAQGFCFVPGMPVILTGTDTDRPLERWWSLSTGRRNAIRGLHDLGVTLVTVPNYSLFNDRPRWDDMHSMKRIAIVHEEFLREGMPAALHVNARTERDWERWTRYVADRSEINYLAFEFATGAGWPSRASWHGDQLARLARAAGRPLHLILRGGSTVLSLMVSVFEQVTVLETNISMKTKSRQRAVMSPAGTLAWQPSPTKPNEAIDALLKENWETVAASYADVFGKKNNSALATQ